jgi:hypothetical protein
MSAYRELTNPPGRLPLPACAGRSVSYKEKEELEKAVRNGVESHGLSFADTPRLNVAWPQKHPSANHANAATGHAVKLYHALSEIFPDKEILLADAIYETKHLGRSEKSHMLYTLTARNEFAADPALLEEPFPFLTEEGAKGEAFVLTDWAVMQGATMANFASFITHNGGHVAAIALSYGGKAMRQESYPADTDERGVPQRGQIPLLASAFKKASTGYGDYSAEECVRLFDRALELNGLSLDTLTNGECLELYKELNDRYANFPGFVERLGFREQNQRHLVARMRERFIR